MVKPLSKRRQRGAILSLRGVARWQTAIADAEQSTNNGQRFPLEDLADRIRIFPKTVRKVLKCQTCVDRSTLDLCFSAFQLQLASPDLDYPESPVTLAIKASPPPQLSDLPRCDWGEAPDHEPFYGREQELTQLSQWIQHDHCRTVTLLGLVGVGKTCLASRLAHQLAPNFSTVIWRSLRHLSILMAELMVFLSHHQPLEPTLSNLINELRRQRCLIVIR